MSDMIPADSAKSIKERVESKIKNSFVDLVSDDEWKAMIEAAWNKFFVRTDRNYGRGKQSEFDMICQQVIKEMIKERVRNAIAGMSLWNDDAFAKQLIELAAENAGHKIVEAWGNEMLRMALQNIQMNIQ